MIKFLTWVLLSAVPTVLAYWLLLSVTGNRDVALFFTSAVLLGTTIGVITGLRR